MDFDFQYELYNEWVESKEKITLAEFCYKKGRNDAIYEFKEKLLDLCSGGEECIDCIGGTCTKCMDNSVDYSSIVDLAEQMKEDSKK